MTRGIYDDGNAAPSWLHLGDAGAAPSAGVARALDLLAAVLLAGGGLGLLAAAAPTDPPPTVVATTSGETPQETPPDQPKGQVEAKAQGVPTSADPPAKTSSPEPRDAPADTDAGPGEAPALAGDPNKPRDPKAAEALAERGQQALKGGKRSSARRLFEEALSFDPNNTEALMGLSNLSFDAANYATAEKYARQAVQLAPRNADYNLRLGDAYLKLGQIPRARTHYQRAAKLGHPFAAARLERLPKGK